MRIQGLMIKARLAGICNLCKRARRITAKEELHWIYTKGACSCRLGSIVEEGTQTERMISQDIEGTIFGIKKGKTFGIKDTSWAFTYTVYQNKQILSSQLWSYNHSFTQYFASMLPLASHLEYRSDDNIVCAIKKFLSQWEKQTYK